MAQNKVHWNCCVYTLTLTLSLSLKGEGILFSVDCGARALSGAPAVPQKNPHPPGGRGLREL
jgi:hypothetical protein